MPTPPRSSPPDKYARCKLEVTKLFFFSERQVSVNNVKSKDALSNSRQKSANRSSLLMHGKFLVTTCTGLNSQLGMEAFEECKGTKCGGLEGSFPTFPPLQETDCPQPTFHKFPFHTPMSKTICAIASLTSAGMQASADHLMSASSVPQHAYFQPLPWRVLTENFR